MGYTPMLQPSGPADPSPQSYQNLDHSRVSLPIIQHPKKLKSLKVFVYIVTGCSVIILLFGVTALSLSLTSGRMAVKPIDINKTKGGPLHSGYNYYRRSYTYRLRTPCCIGGTSLWGGIFLIITGALGMVTVRFPLHKCSRVTFLVLAVIATVLSALICILHGIWAGVISGPNRWRFSNYDHQYGVGNWTIVGGWKIGGVISLNAMICLLGFVNMLCLIVASSLWCCNWCSCCGGAADTSHSEPVRYTIGYAQPNQGYAEPAGYASHEGYHAGIPVSPPV